MTAASVRQSTARWVMSPRLPIGVATITNVPGNSVDLLVRGASLPSARFASSGDRMARHPFRTVVLSAAFGLALATQLSGCTAPEQQPQPILAGPPPAATPLPAAPPPVQQAAAPTPIQAVTNGRAKVAMLVPLTGPNATVGQAMLDAANMA